MERFEVVSDALLRFGDPDIALSFFVPGTAQTAGSKSIVPIQKDGQTVGRRVVESGDRSAKAAWRADVREAAERAIENHDDLLRGGREWPTSEPLAVSVTFIRTRLKGHFGTGRNQGVLKASAPAFPITRPDLSKTWRAAEDALTGILWVDDAVIVAQHVYKRWGEREGVQIVVRRLAAA